MRRRWLTTVSILLICIGSPLLQGCDKFKEMAKEAEDAKDHLKAFLLNEDRDVYKPIREGRVVLDRLPNGTELMTWRKYYTQRYEWHKKSYVDNYLKHGDRSPSWDDAVIDILGEYALFRRETTDIDFRRRLLDKVDKIINLGCEDPRILSIKGILLFNIENSVAATPFLHKGFELLEKSSYPRRYVFFAASHLCMVYSRSQGQASPWSRFHQTKMKYLGQAAGDSDYFNGNQRFYIEDYVTAFDGADCRMPENAEICIKEIADAKQVDPWIESIAMGIYHIANGWKHRGTGYATSVSDEGWRQFESEKEIARKHLTTAYELHRDYPEASSYMIRIAMASSNRTDLKMWFNRSVRAHFDYLPAYKSMLWALRPRWGGSHDEMLKFGIECLTTGRFDTRVPSRFLVALFDIGGELNNWRSPYHWPGMYDLIQQYFSGLLEEPANKSLYNENQSFYAVVAWASGQYEDARRIREELDSDFDPKAYAYLNVTEQQVMNDLRIK